MAIKPLLLVNLGLNEVNPVQCGWQKCEPMHAYGPTVRDHYLLHYVVKGCGTFETGGKSYHLVENEIFVIHPFETTYYIADQKEPWEYIWLGFSASVPLPEALKGSVLHLPEAFSVFHSLTLAERMQEGREAFLLGAIWQLLAYLREQERSARLLPERAVETAARFIETDYANALSVSRLAAQLHMNRSYFSTLFKSRVGVSPQKYYTRVRLQKAAELMTEFGFTPGEAAELTGYPDLSSFSRMFKRYYSVSPSAYRAEKIKTG